MLRCATEDLAIAAGALRGKAKSRTLAANEACRKKCGSCRTKQHERGNERVAPAWSLSMPFEDGGGALICRAW